MTIPLQCSRYLMRSTTNFLFPRRMPKSISNFPKIVLANNNPNWVNVLEAEIFLPSSETPTSQQLSQLIDLLTKAFRKLAANLTSATNFVPSINKNLDARYFWWHGFWETQQLSFLMLTPFLHKSGTVQHVYCRDKLHNNLSNRSHTKLCYDSRLGVKLEKKPYIGFTQENSMGFLITMYPTYIC